jgi:hypothetical protein
MSLIRTESRAGISFIYVQAIDSFAAAMRNMNPRRWFMHKKSTFSGR